MIDRPSLAPSYTRSPSSNQREIDTAITIIFRSCAHDTLPRSLEPVEARESWTLARMTPISQLACNLDWQRRACDAGAKPSRSSTITTIRERLRWYCRNLAHVQTSQLAKQIRHFHTLALAVAPPRLSASVYGLTTLFP